MSLYKVAYDIAKGDYPDDFKQALLATKNLNKLSKQDADKVNFDLVQLMNKYNIDSMDVRDGDIVPNTLKLKN
jgi:hypothetical protein